MPEPPKITTSLAERIARLNATQSNSPDRNTGRGQQEIGEIRSKISKYEATGQHEAPLVPKGSFGLGAPLAKPTRGLDRIRIASLGVSGGTKVATQAGLPAERSVSVGCPKSYTPAPSARLEEAGPNVSRKAQSVGDEAATPEAKSAVSGALAEPDTYAGDAEVIRSARQSTESGDAYDGILDGYPTTPAEGDDVAPMVTCSHCAVLVELEQLAEHVCQLPPGRSDQSHSSAHPRPVPADVPVDADQCSLRSDLGAEQLELPELDVPEEVETSSTNSVPQEPVPSSPQPTVVVDEDPVELGSPDKPAKHSHSPSPEPLHMQLPGSLPASARRISDSSNSTNTRLGRSEGASSVRHSWYDDDDEENYQLTESTGFATIVRSSHKV